MDKKVSKYSNNPHLDSIKKWVKPQYNKELGSEIIPSLQAINTSTGEVKEIATIYKSRNDVDKKPYMKVFKDFYKNKKYLTREACTTLDYIMSILKPHEDFIFLPVTETMEALGFKSKMSLYNGINNLIEYEYISKATISTKYWINVDMFFNGDRKRLL